MAASCRRAYTPLRRWSIRFSQPVIRFQLTPVLVHHLQVVDSERLKSATHSVDRTACDFVVWRPGYVRCAAVSRTAAFFRIYARWIRRRPSIGVVSTAAQLTGIPPVVLARSLGFAGVLWRLCQAGRPGSVARCDTSRAWSRTESRSEGARDDRRNKYPAIPSAVH